MIYFDAYRIIPNLLQEHNRIKTTTRKEYSMTLCLEFTQKEHMMATMTKHLTLCITALLALFFSHHVQAAKNSEMKAPRTVSTFESISIYWMPGPDAAGGECATRYRAEGNDNWCEALPLWFDKRNHEYRSVLMDLSSRDTRAPSSMCGWTSASFL